MDKEEKVPFLCGGIVFFLIMEAVYKNMMYKFNLMYKTFFVREVSKPQEIEYDILVNLLFIIRHIMLRISFLNRFDDGLLMLHYVVNAIEKEASIMGWENIQRVIFSEMNSDINSQDEFEFQHPDNERSVIERIESLVYTVMVGYLKKNYSRDENTIQIVKRFFDMVDKYKPMDEGDKDLQVLKDMRVLRKAFYANDRTKIPERFRDLVVYPSEHKKNETAEDN